ncbi:MAG: hypothetical protein JO129_04425 [Candidatus Dependentiae bacterium]|nr:hypothetical protein [Candidatus Dependentiae bacterium]
MKFNVYGFLLFLIVTPIQASDCFRGIFAGRPQAYQATALTPDEILQREEDGQIDQLITRDNSIPLQELHRSVNAALEVYHQRKEAMKMREMILASEELHKPVPINARELVSIKNKILPFLNSQSCYLEEKKLYTLLLYLESALHKRNYCTPVDRSCWCVTESIKALLCCPCVMYYSKDFSNPSIMQGRCAKDFCNPNCCSDYETTETLLYNNERIILYQKQLDSDDGYLGGHDYCEFYCDDTCAYYVAKHQVRPLQELISHEIDSIIQKEIDKRNAPIEASAIPSAPMLPVQAHVISRDGISSSVDSRI